MSRRYMPTMTRANVGRGALITAAVLALVAVGPRVTRSHTTGHFALAAAPDACAQDAITDGSCGPAPDYVCGLNGKNYVDKVYVPQPE
jgi:hypothetical protein